MGPTDLAAISNSLLHDEHSHACFVGETKIETIEGFQIIKDISIGDLVRTPNGYRKVLNKYKRYSSNLRKVTYGDLEVCCTAEHQFFTEKGLLYSDALSYNCVPYTIKELEICRQKYGLKSYKQNIGFKESFLSQKMDYRSTMMAINIDGTVHTTGHQSQRLDRFQRCIAQFGQRISVIFRKVFISIIKMAMEKTMLYQTCSCFQDTNTQKYIWTYPKEKKNRDKSIKKAMQHAKEWHRSEEGSKWHKLHAKKHWIW